MQDAELKRRAGELTLKQAQIDKLTLEIALLRRYRFGRRAEQLGDTQHSLFEEACTADLQEIAAELKALAPAAAPAEPRQTPKRQALPPELPRIEILHGPESTHCPCGGEMQLVREEVTEKLDYTPGAFTAERHIRPIFACRQCEHVVEAPMPAYVIDKGLATPGLLAHVLVAKYADHLPLNRQETIFARAGVALSRSTLAEWVRECGFALQPLVAALRAEILECRVLHADETPVKCLKPGEKGVQHAYLWAYTPGAHEDIKAVVYDFAESRSGEHARAFLEDWKGSLVCDDYSGYKLGFSQGITEIGCWAHYPECRFMRRRGAESPPLRKVAAPVRARHNIQLNRRQSLQIPLHTSLSPEVYVASRGWKLAQLPVCPLHPAGGCGMARHGSYARAKPSGIRVARWYCPRGHRTFSLIPDFLAARLPGLLTEVEEVIFAAARSPSIEAAAASGRELSVSLPSAIRWFRRRLGPVRRAIQALQRSDIKVPAAGCGFLTRFRLELDDQALARLPPPLGFAVRSGDRGALEGFQHKMGPDERERAVYRARQPNPLPLRTWPHPPSRRRLDIYRPPKRSSACGMQTAASERAPSGNTYPGSSASGATAARSVSRRPGS